MKYLLAGFLSLALVGCGGGGSDAPAPVMVVPNDTTLNVTATQTAAVKDVPFVFGSGLAELGTSTPTTVIFTDDTATPAFSISADGNTATGTTTFGSCIFAISASSFPAGHRLAAGQTITFNPCNLQVGTAGMVANGVSTNRSVALVLGAARSVGASVTVGVDPDGRLVLNGTVTGTVTLTPATGAS